MKAERIAHLYADPGPFASVFIDVSRASATGAHEVELRLRDAAERLAGEGAPGSVTDTVLERLKQSDRIPSPASQVVVATERGVLLDEVVHAHAVRSTASWAVLPDIGDWIAGEDAAIPFVLALVDHEGGQVLTYGSDWTSPSTAETIQNEDEHEHKVRGGALANRRLQNRAENVWAQNASEVADLIGSRISAGLRLILLAGEPTSRTQVRDALEPRGELDVVELEHGGRARDGGDTALHDAVRNVLVERAASRRLRAVHDLKDQLGVGSGAVTGVRDVADAFVRGQVESLLLDHVDAADAELAPADHPGLALSGAPASEPVRADMGLVAAAARTGAEIVVSPTSTLFGAPVAAVLRWSGGEEQ